MTDLIPDQPPVPPTSGPPAADPPAADPPHRVTRRRFLAGGAVVLGCAMVGGAVAAGVTRPWSTGGTSRALPPGTGTLVLVTLYGGNDGLNTVVPIADPAYARLRPTLGYHADEVLPLTDGLALNPKLTGLHDRWHAGQMAVVLGVGYPEPSLSHFTSMDIWQTGRPPSGDGSGWIGRWLDTAGTDPLNAVSIGDTLPTALRGTHAAATALTGPAIDLPGGPEVRAAYSLLQAPGRDRTGLAASVAGSGQDLLAVQRRLDALGHAPGSTPAAPAAPRTAGAADLATQLTTVATLIKAGTGTRVYQVSLSPFDTHADERADHERLLSELDAAIQTFFTSLGSSPHAADVVLATYSEFGRRPAENSSGGTDHGTAAPVLVVGPGVQGGRLLGEQPSLTELDDNGNQKFAVDFRSVYATLLADVVGADPSPVLGGRWPTLQLV